MGTIFISKYLFAFNYCRKRRLSKTFCLVHAFRSTTSTPTSSWTRLPWNQRRKEQLLASPGGLRTPPRPLISASWKRGWKKPRSTWQSKCVWQRLRDYTGGNHSSGEWSRIRKTFQQLCREAFSSVLAAEKRFCLLSSLLLFIWPSLLVKNEVLYTAFVLW